MQPNKCELKLRMLEKIRTLAANANFFQCILGKHVWPRMKARHIPVHHRVILANGTPKIGFAGKHSVFVLQLSLCSKLKCNFRLDVIVRAASLAVGGWRGAEKGRSPRELKLRNDEFSHSCSMFILNN